MAFEELTIFLLECLLAVMFALIGNVLLDTFNHGLGNGEGSVTGLPGETRELRSLGLDPFGRCFLNILNGLVDGHSAGEVEE